MVMQRGAKAEENVESSSVGEGLDPPRDKFSQLYEQGMKKIQRQHQLSVMAIAPDCTFKPKITVHTSEHVRRDDQANVFERMYTRA